MTRFLATTTFRGAGPDQPGDHEISWLGPRSGDAQRNEGKKPWPPRIEARLVRPLENELLSFWAAH